MDINPFAIDEIARRELKQVLAQVLREVAPSEAAKFDEVGMDLLKGPADRKGRAAPAESQVRTRGLPVILEAGLVSLHLVSGTLALIELYRGRKDRKDQQEIENSIREEWKRALMKAGMSLDLANQVPVKYSADMIRFITQRLNKPDEQ